MKLPFFKFDVMAWLAGKIRLMTPEEQGVFINLCALIWRDGGTYKIDTLTHRQLNTSEQVFNKCLQVLTSAGIVLNKDGILSVKFITEQLNKYEEVREKRSEAGRISGEKRRSAEQVSTNKERRKKKEESRKKKEDKEEDGDTTGVSRDVVEYLNKVCNTKYRSNTPATQKHISARIKDGFGFEDFRIVVDKKFNEWNCTDQAKYLRPETLFGNKFESYLNQLDNSNQPTLPIQSSVQSESIPMRPHLWNCPKCKSQVFGGSSACLKCDHPYRAEEHKNV